MGKIKEEGFIVLGAGGHAKVVISSLQALESVVDTVLDDDPAKKGSQLLGVPVQGPICNLSDESSVKSIIAIGENSIRETIAARFKQLHWITVVHPKAYVHSSVKLGPGTVVFAGAVIQPDSKIGAHVIINTGATVDHDSVIGDFAHIAPGATIAGGVVVGQRAFLGTGATVIPGVRIGQGAIVGAGGVVVKDVPDNVTVIGNPAKPMGSDK